jgi:MoaD family protein
MNMPTAVLIPAGLRMYCEGASEIEVSGETVREVLERLGAEWPLVYQGVCDETGAVRRHINLFVNELHVRQLDGLQTALQSGDTLTIFPSVSGG